MKIVFFGTPQFAASILEFLIDKVEIAAVVTQPDKERGRSSKKELSVKEMCQGKLPSIPLYQPEKASDPLFLEELKQYASDLFIVVAYGKILKSSLLHIPRLDTINVHASLLPKYRGAAPIQRAIMNGEKETGITIMKIIPELDAGDMIAKEKIAITDEMNCQDVEEALLAAAKPLLLQVIHLFSKGKHCVSYKAQEASQASYAAKIDAEERRISWSLPARKIFNLIRAFSPFPGAETSVMLNGKKKQLKIKKAAVVPIKASPAQIVRLTREELVIGCEEESLALLEVQLEGKKTIPIKEFLSGVQTGFSLEI